MAKRDEVFPSKYLKAGDLKGTPITVTIVSAPIETLKTPDGRDTKTVLYFRGAKKHLPLNRTNWDAVANICGDDSDDRNAVHGDLGSSGGSVRHRRTVSLGSKEAALP